MKVFAFVKKAMKIGEFVIQNVHGIDGNSFDIPFSVSVLLKTKLKDFKKEVSHYSLFLSV